MDVWRTTYHHRMDDAAAIVQWLRASGLKPYVDPLTPELQAQFLAEYQRRIERLIGRMVRDTDLVQDIAQETFIRAYRALPQFRGESAFYTWLYRIAVNSAKKALTDMKRDPVITESALATRQSCSTSRSFSASLQARCTCDVNW